MRRGAVSLSREGGSPTEPPGSPFPTPKPERCCEKPHPEHFQPRLAGSQVLAGLWLYMPGPAAAAVATTSSSSSLSAGVQAGRAPHKELQKAQPTWQTHTLLPLPGHVAQNFGTLDSLCVSSGRWTSRSRNPFRSPFRDRVWAEGESGCPLRSEWWRLLIARAGLPGRVRSFKLSPRPSQT